MAIQALTVSLVNGQAIAGGTRDTASAYAAVDAAIVVLVADGASPTQAHVTTLNNAWGPLKTEVAATGVLRLEYDDATLNTSAKKRDVVNAIARALGLPGV